MNKKKSEKEFPREAYKGMRNNHALSVEEILRLAYPHGHPDFIGKCIKEMALHSDKNYDYAAGGDPLGNLKRVANMLSMYPGLDLSDAAVVTMVLLLKQLDAYLWLKSNKHKPKVEGTGPRLRDISVYTKIADIIDTETIGERNK
jgi:hypothetical protein